MSRQSLSAVFFTIAILFAALAALTLVPFSSLKRSDLGYFALCPFAPWSTLMLLFVAGVGWALHRHTNQRL
jgi:hypothetical protein